MFMQTIIEAIILQFELRHKCGVQLWCFYLF